MHAGCRRRASRSPSAAVPAVRTVNPSRVRNRSISSRTCGSSSITSTVRSAASPYTLSASWPVGNSGPLLRGMGAAAGSAGSISTNSAPWPGSLVTVIGLPPSFSVSAWQMLRPRPVPPCWRVVVSSAW